MNQQASQSQEVGSNSLVALKEHQVTTARNAKHMEQVYSQWDRTESLSNSESDKESNPVLLQPGKARGEMQMKNMPTTKSQQHQQKDIKSILGRVVTEMVERGRAFSRNETQVTAKRSTKRRQFSRLRSIHHQNPEAEPRVSPPKPSSQLA